MKAVKYSFPSMASVFAIAVSLCAGAQAETLVECPNDSLRTAVNRATEGEKIIVLGTCTEEVVVKRDGIRIIGRSSAMIQPPPGGTAITVFSDGVKIRNLNIVGGAVGIDVTAGASAEIVRNNFMDYTEAGTRIRANSNGVLDTNTFSSVNANLAAINMVASASAQLTDNTIDHVAGGYGINIASTSTALLACNTISISHPFFAAISVSRTAQLGFAPGCANTIVNTDEVGRAIFCSQTSSIFAGENQNLTGAVDLHPNCEVVTLGNVSFP